MRGYQSFASGHLFVRYQLAATGCKSSPSLVQQHSPAPAKILRVPQTCAVPSTVTSEWQAVPSTSLYTAPCSHPANSHRGVDLLQTRKKRRRRKKSIAFFPFLNIFLPCFYSRAAYRLALVRGPLHSSLTQSSLSQPRKHHL